MSWKEIDIHELQINPMDMIGDQWMLITAGNEENGCNTMTAAWGHMGSLWNLPGKKGHAPTAVIYVRPQRYTYEFVEREPLFTLTFFDESKKKALGYLGTVSGRDCDKINEAGLTKVYGEGTTWFEEAELVLICRKLYRTQLQEDGFIDREVMERNYPERDFHYVYVGEIVKALVHE